MQIVYTMLTWRKRNKLITVQEQKHNAEKALFYLHQTEYFKELRITLAKHGKVESKHRLAHLAPFLDKDNPDRPLIRLGGRIRFASHLRFDIRCPILVDPSDKSIQNICLLYTSDAADE